MCLFFYRWKDFCRYLSKYEKPVKKNQKNFYELKQSLLAYYFIPAEMGTTKEYLGTIESMSMNLTHAAVMFDGKLQLHQVIHC